MLWLQPVNELRGSPFVTYFHWRIASVKIWNVLFSRDPLNDAAQLKSWIQNKVLKIGQIWSFSNATLFCFCVPWRVFFTHRFWTEAWTCSLCYPGCACRSLNWTAPDPPPTIQQLWDTTDVWLRRISEKNSWRKAFSRCVPTHTLGNTLVIPPSVDANTDRKPYLQEFILTYSLCS